MKIEIAALAHKHGFSYAIAASPDCGSVYMYHPSRKFWRKVFGPVVSPKYKQTWFKTMTETQKITRGKLFIEVTE